MNNDYSYSGPIGVFDSGYGGLTILERLRRLMPQYDFIYLGDNARAPYGTRSFRVVYEFTRQAVRRLFQMGCPLVILGCNTASAKALRTIQQVDLPLLDPTRRVLGIIRPTAECVGSITRTGHVGIVATSGTIRSNTYDLEIAKLHPGLTVTGQACPLWATLVENGETDCPGTDYFVGRDLQSLLSADPQIDTIILGCTHYPLLLPLIRRHVPDHITLIPQGDYVANSLKNYLSRHPEMETRLTRGASVTYYTTEDPQGFNASAAIFLSQQVEARHVVLE
ncbi:MAG: glutamate racemase [Bacteroidaceae bacterium]|nr:glutamate racemase [Bacteroidaceae bacterium]